MYRQGSARVKFSKDYTFTYPATSSNLGSLTMETLPATAGVESQFRPEYVFTTHKSCTRLATPFTINGIRCDVSSSSVTPLEPCTDVAGDWIMTYGSTISPKVDVNVYYIGRNGVYKNTDQLVAQYDEMVRYGSDQYIVLGFHEPISKLSSIRNVDKTYLEKMEQTFGKHFLNLNKEIRLRAAELTYITGIYDIMYGFYLNDEDYEYVTKKGDIPRSLYRDDLFHPNEEGANAFAILIHDKMVKLGYLKDNYILSTGSEL